MIARRILPTGIALATSCIILAITASIYVNKERKRKAAEQQEELINAAHLVRQTLETTVNEILLEAGSQLVAMHSEGLPFQLTRWQNSNPFVDASFIYSPRTGFSSDLPALPNLSAHFFSTQNFKNASLLATYGDSTPFNWDSGYFLENLENIQYAGFTPAPIIQWYSQHAGTDLKLICWHRLHEEGTIRGFTLNSHKLLNRLQIVIDSTTPPLIKISLLEITQSSQRKANTNIQDTPLITLPGWSLFSQYKENRSLVNALPFISQILIGISLLLALVSCGFIIHLSNRKHKEALKKTNFVALVSHELKTPLTSISMYAELIDNPKITSEKQHKFATTILRQSERLREMIDNLLLLSSIENQDRSSEIKQIDLIPILNEITTELEPTLSEKGIRLEYSDNQENFWIKADANSIRRVFINLIDNAKKYAPSGELITIDLNNKAKQPTAIIRDLGPGIPPNKAEIIFSPFSQLDNQLADKSPGIGIGLNLSRNLMLEMGGTLELEKTYTKGAAFILTFTK